MFNSLEEILQKALNNKVCKKLVLAGAEDIFSLQAIEKLTKLGLIAPIFVGNKQNIVTAIKENNLDLENHPIIDAESPNDIAEQSINLINSGEAFILMKGLISTRILLKAVIKNMDTPLSPGLLSHLALFESPHVKKVFGLTDAAININPNVEATIKIIQNAVGAFNTLGYSNPKVALLAAVEKVNVKMQSTINANAIAKMHAEVKLASCEIAGPLSLDIAISEAAAQHKGISNPVAGHADLLVVPEINSGNIFYKSLTYLGNARSAGILLGTKTPVVLSSRADSPESKLFSVALGLNLAK